MPSWPGIPEGRGSTCSEEGCGNPRRPSANDCRVCYRRKWTQDRRAKGLLLDGAGGYEIDVTPSVSAEIDAATYSNWQTMRDTL